MPSDYSQQEVAPPPTAPSIVKVDIDIQNSFGQRGTSNPSLAWHSLLLNVFAVVGFCWCCKEMACVLCVYLMNFFPSFDGPFSVEQSMEQTEENEHETEDTENEMTRWETLNSILSLFRMIMELGQLMLPMMTKVS